MSSRFANWLKILGNSITRQSISKLAKKFKKMVSTSRIGQFQALAAMYVLIEEKNYMCVHLMLNNEIYCMKKICKRSAWKYLLFVDKGSHETHKLQIYLFIYIELKLLLICSISPAVWVTQKSNTNFNFLTSILNFTAINLVFIQKFSLVYFF